MRATVSASWEGLAARRILLCAAAFLMVWASPEAAPARTLDVGFADPLLYGGSPEVRADWLDHAVADRAGTIKMFVSWRSVVGSKEPTEPQSPADPGYNFDILDGAVADASARGLEVLFGVQSAPGWAEGSNRPESAAPGTWKPRPRAIQDFMTALATRYSGSFHGLPRVEDYELWNEPNLPNYLTPQSKGGKPFAARHYKRMLNAAHRGLKSVSSGNRLVTGGLAPYGDAPGGDRTRPLQFLREILCLRHRKKLKRDKKCRGKAAFDVLSAHAINTSGPPTQSALHPDDASSGDLKKVTRTLRAAERRNTVRGKGRHPLWVTEYWWWSRPPSKNGVSLMRQARYIEQTMYLSWDAGFEKAIQLRIRDADPANAPYIYSDGLYFLDGDPKPAVRAFRFPFVADRRGGKKVRLWGKAPGPGGVVIERRQGKHWKRVARLKVGRSRIFSETKRIRGKPELRARAGGEKSLPWKVGWS